MIGVGCEFEIDKTKLGSYAKDYMVASNKLTHFRVVFSLATMAGPQHVHNVHFDSSHVRCHFANMNNRCAQSIVFLYHILIYLNSYFASMHIHITNPQIPVKNTG